MTRQAFICDAIRTPFGRYGGALSSVRADDLGAIPLRALMARNPTDGERRIESQKIREASREQIRTILTPEQRAKYDQQVAEQSTRGGSIASSGRVFILGPDGKPKAVTAQLGISDGTFTEITGGELKEGQEVVSGGYKAISRELEDARKIRKGKPEGIEKEKK